MEHPNFDGLSLSLVSLMVFSASSFIVFGLSCLYSPYMVSEFERYGLKQFRKANGFLQLVGALGLFLGFYYRMIGLAASAGLVILMLLGLGTRLKIRDGFLKSIPAFFYMIVNIVIYFLLIRS
ncbi:MAG: DoxX family protein [Bacteroidota bacterium]